MCLLVFAVNAHPRYRLIAAGNRDEFHARPTQAAGWWPTEPPLLAGRDLEAGGTWLGIGRNQRFAAITNIRDMAPTPAGAPSRGELVPAFIGAKTAAAAYLDDLVGRADAYAGFNLVVDDGKAVHFFASRSGRRERLDGGIHGLSNDNLDTPWPKVVKAAAGVRQLLGENEPDIEALFDVFADRAIAPDAELPDTGIGREFERMLSACFIVSPQYGTRSTTLVFVEHDGAVKFYERQFDHGGEMSGEQSFEFASMPTE